MSSLFAPHPHMLTPEPCCEPVQGLNLVEAPMAVADVLNEVRKNLPRCIVTLTSLTALNLADNSFVRVPPLLSKLTALQYLDMSCNSRLQVCVRALTCGRMCTCPLCAPLCFL